MPRKKSKVGNGPVPQDTSGIGEITKEKIRRIKPEALDKSFDELEKNLDKMSEITDRLLRAADHRLAGLEHNARQPRLATKAYEKSDIETPQRAEDAAADQAKHGDSCAMPARQV